MPQDMGPFHVPIGQTVLGLPDFVHPHPCETLGNSAQLILRIGPVQSRALGQDDPPCFPQEERALSAKNDCRKPPPVSGLTEPPAAGSAGSCAGSMGIDDPRCIHSSEHVTNATSVARPKSFSSVDRFGSRALIGM